MTDANDTTEQSDAFHVAERDTVQSVGTLVLIIETLRKLDGAGVTEVAEQTGMSKSTAYRHLMTLREREYVVKDEATYQLGYRFLELGGYVRNRDVSDLIKRKVTELARETGERAQYVVEEYGYGVFAYSHSGEHGVSTGIDVGIRTPIHATSAGKAILAHLIPERTDQIIEKRGIPQQTEHSLSSEEELYKELETIREQGYALDRGEHVEGLYCVGVPLTEPDGGVLGALSVAGPKYRLEGERMETKLSKLILGATNELELKIAYE